MSRVTGSNPHSSISSSPAVSTGAEAPQVRRRCQFSEDLGTQNDEALRLYKSYCYCTIAGFLFGSFSFCCLPSGTQLSSTLLGMVSPVLLIAPPQPPLRTPPATKAPPQFPGEPGLAAVMACGRVTSGLDGSGDGPCTWKRILADDMCTTHKEKQLRPNIFEPWTFVNPRWDGTTSRFIVFGFSQWPFFFKAQHDAIQ